MKNTIYFILGIALMSCNSKPTKSVNHKFNTGDVVYLKIDSKKIIISSRTIIRDTQPAYYIDYIDEDGDYTNSLIGEYCLTKTFKNK